MLDMRLALACLLLASSTGIGCATLIRGTHRTVEIQSRPPDAEVSVDGVAHGRTPVRVDVEAGQPHTIVVSAPDHEPQTVRTERSLSGGFVFIDVLLGIVPLIIDASTDAWYDVQPAPINVMLRPIGARGTQGPARAEGETE